MTAKKTESKASAASKAKPAPKATPVKASKPAPKKEAAAKAETPEPKAEEKIPVEEKQPEITVTLIPIEERAPQAEQPKRETPKKKSGVALVYEKSREDAISLSLGYDGDAGIDLYTPTDVIIPPKWSTSIDTGIVIEMPQVPDFMKEHFRMACVLHSKGGLSVNHKVEKGAGLIDDGYEGSIFVHLFNHGNRAVNLKAGDKIAQMVFTPVLKVTSVEEGSVSKGSERGTKKMGSQG